MPAAERIRVQSLRFQGPLYQQILLPLQQGKYDELPSEFCAEGPTGTGKSVVFGGLTKFFARSFPGANILVLRRIKADLAGSFMQMWEEEILDPTDPWDMWMLDQGTGRIPSHRSRDVYKYPNGSKIWCRGMDQWARVKSMAYDLIWCMEGTEFEEEHIEGLHTRKRKRRGVEVPWRALMLDVNPEYPGHWLNQRMIRGDCVRIKTTLKDNPGYFDLQKNDFTNAGAEYRAELFKRLKGGPRAARYIAGEWVAAEGQILDWDESRHIFDGEIVRDPGKRDRIKLHRTHPVLGDFVDVKGYAASYDWGIRHAGVLAVWAIDDDGRMYLVEEVYRSGQTLTWWANWAVQLTKKYELRTIVCDNAAIDTIHHFNTELQQKAGAKSRIAVPCDKRSGNREQSNLEILRELFADADDGKPQVFFKRNALAHAPDPDLNIKRTVEEVPGYVYAPYEASRHTGRPEDKPDKACVDDGLDATCYMRVHLLGGRSVAEKINKGNPNTNVRRALYDSYWNKRATTNA